MHTTCMWFDSLPGKSHLMACWASCKFMWFVRCSRRLNSASQFSNAHLNFIVRTWSWILAWRLRLFLVRNTFAQPSRSQTQTTFSVVALDAFRLPFCPLLTLACCSVLSTCGGSGSVGTTTLALLVAEAELLCTLVKWEDRYMRSE